MPRHILNIYFIIYLYIEYIFYSLGASQRFVSSTCESASGGSWAGSLPDVSLPLHPSLSHPSSSSSLSLSGSPLLGLLQGILHSVSSPGPASCDFCYLQSGSQHHEWGPEGFTWGGPACLTWRAARSGREGRWELRLSGTWREDEQNGSSSSLACGLVSVWLLFIFLKLFLKMNCKLRFGELFNSDSSDESVMRAISTQIWHFFPWEKHEMAWCEQEFHGFTGGLTHCGGLVSFSWCCSK